MEGLVKVIDSSFWRDKKVFITGHTGFKGSWMSLWLYSLGANVKGFSKGIPTNPSLFYEACIHQLISSDFNDIRNKKQLEKSILEFDPEIIINMAAQPLVRYSYHHPVETFETNIMGTVNLLDVIRSCKSVQVLINITSDKCYENDGRSYGYSENDRLGGYDPYSSSKACAEIVASAFTQSFFNNYQVGIASVRAGNVIGGGDWGKDRLIPDILRALNTKERKIIIRNPQSIRPWQHVLEPLSGYLVLAQNIFQDKKQYSGGWNFGPDKDSEKTVEWIVKEMISDWENMTYDIDIGDNLHEADILRLNIDKAKSELNWQPKWSLPETIKKINMWHKNWLTKKSMTDICFKEIDDYMEVINS